MNNVVTLDDYRPAVTADELIKKAREMRTGPAPSLEQAVAVLNI